MGVTNFPRFAGLGGPGDGAPYAANHFLIAMLSLRAQRRQRDGSLFDQHTHLLVRDSGTH